MYSLLESGSNQGGKQQRRRSITAAVYDAIEGIFDLNKDANTLSDAVSTGATNENGSSVQQQDEMTASNLVSADRTTTSSAGASSPSPSTADPAMATDAYLSSAGVNYDSDSIEKGEKQLVTHNYHDHSLSKASEQPKPKKTGRGGVSKPFPLKLYHMLQQVEKEGMEHIISWQPHGRCFHVHKPKQFVNQVLQRFFLQKKIASFQRQLNLYGFNRITVGPDKGSYYHEFFLRGKPFLIQNINRMKVKGTGARLASNPAAEPNFYEMPFLANDDDDNESEENLEELGKPASTEKIPSTSRALNGHQHHYHPSPLESAAIARSVGNRRRSSLAFIMSSGEPDSIPLSMQSQHEMPPLSSYQNQSIVTGIPSSSLDLPTRRRSSQSMYGGMPLPFEVAPITSRERRRSSLLSLSNFLLDTFMNSERSPSVPTGQHSAARDGLHPHSNRGSAQTLSSLSYYDSARDQSQPADMYNESVSPDLVDMIRTNRLQLDLPMSFHEC